MHVLLTYKCISQLVPKGIVNEIILTMLDPDNTHMMYDELQNIFANTPDEGITDELVNQYSDILKTTINKYIEYNNIDYYNEHSLFLDYIIRADIRGKKAYLYTGDNDVEYDQESIKKAIEEYIAKYIITAGIDINYYSTTILVASINVIIKGNPLCIMDNKGNDANMYDGWYFPPL